MEQINPIRLPKRLLEIEELERKVTVIDITKATSRIYGEIKDKLRAQGTPIPENDIWIAAITKERGLILITKDNHFDHIAGLSVEKL